MRFILSNPAIYRVFQRIIGRDGRMFVEIVDKYVRPRGDDRILDIGCGPADILKYLPNVDYVGLDISQQYIDSARKRFGNSGTFLVGKVSSNAIDEASSFDIALALGVLHHLDDGEAVQLFELAQSALKPEGRLVTVDGCYMDGQPRFVRYLLSKDRGQYVRTMEGYVALASKVFTNVKVTIRYDLYRIPFTHIVLECSSSN